MRLESQGGACQKNTYSNKENKFWGAKNNNITVIIPLEQPPGGNQRFTFIRGEKKEEKKEKKKCKTRANKETPTLY
jgi:hypothetical protein